jgi:serine/threonine protein kinase
MDDQNTQQCHMMLVSSTLVMCTHIDKKSEVIRMINLTGVAVNESEENRMVVKDEPDANFTSTIQFESKEEAAEWLTELKEYSNNYFQSKYDVLEPIGTGKFSIVYRCRERSTSKEYALKIIHL